MSVGLGDHNYCRNPLGGDGGPWCFADSKDVTWERCDVRVCDDCDTSKDCYTVASILNTLGFKDGFIHGILQGCP